MSKLDVIEVSELQWACTEISTHLQ